MKLNNGFPFKIYGDQDFRSPAMVIGWAENEDILGWEVTYRLIKSLGCSQFGEIETGDFFSTTGTLGKDGGVRPQDSKFYHCQKNNLVIFRSYPPRFEWYRFLDSVLDVAEHLCRVRELYTVSSKIVSCSHSIPRELSITANSPEFGGELTHYAVAEEVVCKTTPARKPTLNSFILWLAGRRNIVGADLSVSVPYYLKSTVDAQACRKSAEFLSQRLNLGIDFRELDDEISRQNERLSQLRNRSPEIECYIRKLESKTGLTSSENEELVRAVKELYQHPYLSKNSG